MPILVTFCCVLLVALLLVCLIAYSQTPSSSDRARLVDQAGKLARAEIVESIIREQLKNTTEDREFWRKLALNMEKRQDDRDDEAEREAQMRDWNGTKFEPLTDQVNRLAKVILEEFGGPVESEGAVDTAIRFLRRYKSNFGPTPKTVELGSIRAGSPGAQGATASKPELLVEKKPGKPSDAELV